MVMAAGMLSSCTFDGENSSRDLRCGSRPETSGHAFYAVGCCTCKYLQQMGESEWHRHKQSRSGHGRLISTSCRPHRMSRMRRLRAPTAIVTHTPYHSLAISATGYSRRSLLPATVPSAVVATYARVGGSQFGPSPLLNDDAFANAWFPA